MIAYEMGADVIVTLTDVDGFLVKTADGNTKVERNWTPQSQLVVNPKSRVGVEGQEEKVRAISHAIKAGVKVCSSPHIVNTPDIPH